MRRRGQGEIVLVSSGAGRAAIGDPQAALSAAKAFLAAAAALRRALRADGVSVAAIVPGSIAIRAAAWLRAPQLTTVGADRIARRIAGQIGRARRRHHVAITVPGAATVALRALRVIGARVREAMRDMPLPSVAAIGEPADEAPLAGESGPRRLTARGSGSIAHAGADRRRPEGPDLDRAAADGHQIL